MKQPTPGLLPPFIATSVPKSGTHLLHQILNGIPQVSNDITRLDKKFFVNNPPVNFYQDHSDRLAKLKPNEFGLGHLYYSQQYVNMLKKLKLKHIYLYRDPRDVLISLSYFIGDKWPEHPLHHDFNHKYTTPRQRILVLIKGISNKFPNFTGYFRPFYGWLGDTNSLHITFEQLVTSVSSRYKVLHAILNYLWEDTISLAAKNQMASLMENSINPSGSGTFRRGKIGGWKDHFDPEIKQVFKEIVGGLLIETGYEKNYDW
jgi:hypothetical protein